RLALLEWAREAGAWVVEDDYDSEFCYSGERLPALHRLDREERVIYTGTFSKTLFPALRLAYLVVPHDLVGPFEAAKSTTDHASSTVDQAVLTEFIRAGYFARHVRRMVALYRRRLEALEDAVSAELSGVMRLEWTGNGLHAIGWLLDDLDDEAVSAAALARGIEAPALSHFCVERRLPPALVIGFAAIDECAIRPAVKRLARAIESVLAPARVVGP
ncbi:MAG: PLP-dependent aminotransferase family protein, partial [Longimicrobiales bacterium]